MLTDTRFDDLLYLRKGGEGLTMGARLSWLGRIETVEEWRVKAVALKEIFLQTLGEAPDLSCPLDPEVTGETDRGDYLERLVSYRLAPDERTSAYVLLPRARKGKCPAVLCIHPTNPLGKEQTVGRGTSPKDMDRAYAVELVRRGYITIAWDLLGAGSRAYPGLKHFDTAPFYEKYPRWSARGRDLWDAGRAIDCLQAMPEVDPARIGSIGHSQGGGITIHALAYDERIKAGVSSCGLCPDRLAKNPFGQARTGWWVGRPFLRPYYQAGKPSPVDMHEVLALAAPRAVLVINALNDFGFHGEELGFFREALADMTGRVKEVFALCGAPDNFEMIVHEKGHGFEAEERASAYAFLDAKLGNTATGV